MTGNCLVAQSGGPTAVINAAACGVIQAAFRQTAIKAVYGAHNGILGMLNGRLFDLGREDSATIAGLRHTPSSALGTCRYKIEAAAQYDAILRTFHKHDIRFFVYIGGNDSQDTADKIHRYALDAGYAMRVVGVPKTVDNDLCATDHCPGYGSVVKLTAAMVREVGLDTEASCSTDKVNVIETMGRNSGWIAAGTGLARQAPGQAPDIILLPEVDFDREPFLRRVDRLLETQGRCVVVVAEGVRYGDGTYLAEGDGPLAVDAFGHRQLGGAAIVLKTMIERELGAKTRYCRPSIINRNGIHFASATDSEESYRLGVAAVRFAVEGHSGVMTALVRRPGKGYRCDIEAVPLREVANQERPFPREWIVAEENRIDMDRFRAYALPLIQGEVAVPIEDGLPVPVRLRKHFVEQLHE